MYFPCKIVMFTQYKSKERVKNGLIWCQNLAKIRKGREVQRIKSQASYEISAGEK